MAFRNDAIQVKNNSWGAPDATFYEPPKLDGPGFLTVAALADGTTSGRNGLGEVYLFAAGNGRVHGDNANYDGYANSPFVLCVGAVNDLGEQSSFSESGACLAVCAPSLLCINVLGAFWRRNRNHLCMVRIFDILRPLVTGLVITAASLLVLECLWDGEARVMLQRLPDLRATTIVAVAFALTAFTKVSPVYILLGGAGAGFVLGFLGFHV